MPLSEEDKKQGLWRCDCLDFGTHIDIERHTDSCGYALWLIEMSTSDQDLED